MEFSTPSIFYNNLNTLSVAYTQPVQQDVPVVLQISICDRIVLPLCTPL
jgi:hypothetical protein